MDYYYTCPFVRPSVRPSPWLCRVVRLFSRSPSTNFKTPHLCFASTSHVPYQFTAILRLSIYRGEVLFDRSTIVASGWCRFDSPGIEKSVSNRY
jgi:hypothetical protein